MCRCQTIRQQNSVGLIKGDQGLTTQLFLCSRFANHSSKPNCVPKIKLVNGTAHFHPSSFTHLCSFPGDYRIGIYAKQTIFQGDELFFEYMYDAHHRQQFVNNERVDDSIQEGLTILKRYGNNFMLVRPSYD